MLRLAVNLLLACVLCLNGFFAPVAMAHHGGMAMAATQADEAQADGLRGEGSCHDSETGDVATHHAPAADHGGKHDTCCKHGQCLCGCILAANVPMNTLPALHMAGSRTTLPVTLHVATARYAVAVRPPLV